MISPKKSQPTYTAIEIRDMCLSFELDFGTFKILIDLIESELPLYDENDLLMLTHASMIVFSRAMLKASLRFMK